MPIFRLSNPFKYYTWGSTDFIPRLLGQTPSPDKPVAEMWMGAHPMASSQIWVQDMQVSLREYIQMYPNQTLGKAAQLSTSGLPFMLKVLAAAQPLSIQAHPTLEQARLGFERENSLGVLPSSPLRNYKDDNHKPELICALTPFKALCGFRPYPEIVQNFRALGLDQFFSAFEALAKHLIQRSFQSFFLQLMSVSGAQKHAILDKLASSLQGQGMLDAGIRQACLDLLRHYPEDIGVLAPLYLNLFTLQPGQALYLEAGVLHAYLEGAGIEIMANSDNVLRGGLTSKRIDLEELARILDFSAYDCPVIVPQSDSEVSQIYACPAREFMLRHIELDGNQSHRLLTRDLPLILFCEQGNLEIITARASKVIRPGYSVFVTADEGFVDLEGMCRVWLATVPEPQN